MDIGQMIADLRKFPHFTHRSTPSFHSFNSAFYLPHSTFRSSAFYQQPSLTTNKRSSGAKIFPFNIEQATYLASVSAVSFPVIAECPFILMRRDPMFISKKYLSKVNHAEHHQEKIYSGTKTAR